MPPFFFGKKVQGLLLIISGGPVSIEVLTTPTDTDNYGIGWTDLFAGPAVDAIG